MKIKLTYVVSNLNQSVGFEWLAAYTDASRYDVEFIFLNSDYTHLQRRVEEIGVRTVLYRFRGKKDLPVLVMKLFSHFRRQRPDIVHAHLFEASLAGMLAAWLAGVKKRIHTRHHSSLHHNYHRKAVKYDRLINRLSTHIVAVTQSVANILITRESVKEEKVSVVHHGFRLELFSADAIGHDRIAALAAKYNPLEKRPVIGVISRYVDWKGIQYIIPAFEKLLLTYPNALLILANANGNYKKEVQSLLSVLPRASYMEIAFENDIFALYQLFNLFVHVPTSLDAEAFGQIYIEAMAAAAVIVCTHSGISPEVISHERNALVVPYKDTESIFNAFTRLLNDNVLAETLRRNAVQDVSAEFSVQSMIRNLEAVYAK